MNRILGLVVFGISFAGLVKADFTDKKCPANNIHCPAPPPGCSYAPSKSLDKNGCPVGCGSLVCSQPGGLGRFGAPESSPGSSAGGTQGAPGSSGGRTGGGTTTGTPQACPMLARVCQGGAPATRVEGTCDWKCPEDAAGAGGAAGGTPPPNAGSAL